MSTKQEKMFSQAGFPDHLASDEVKDTEAYGLQFAKAIEYEWFYRVGDGQCGYYDNMTKYHKERLYARGEHDTKMHMELLNKGEDSSYANYDTRPIQVLPKFMHLLTNQMKERLFEISAEAQDSYSTDLKNKQREKLEKYVISKPLIKEIKKTTGMDLTPPNADELPQTQEEVDVHMQMKYKDGIEIAGELAIRYTFDLNDYEDSLTRMIEDVSSIGVCGIKHYTDPVKGIQAKAVDPANMVFSHVKHSNFRGVHYYGEVRRITIMELQRIAGRKFTKEELEKMVNATAQWGRYHGRSNEIDYTNDVIEASSVDVMFFCFQTERTSTYKKKYIQSGGFKMTKKNSDFKKPDANYKGYDVEVSKYDVWYEGALVLGTKYLFNYRLEENLVREDGLIKKAIPKYLMFAPDVYEGRFKSLLSQVIPTIDQMQQTHMKIQQLIAKAKPNGIYIDVVGLEDIAMGDGSFLTPLEQIKMYNETGNVLGAGYTEEGMYNSSRQPIQELSNGVNVQGLQGLINAYNFQLNLLRDKIGIPQGADATMPHPDTLVGVQEQVALNSNTATRHILESVLKVTRELGKATSLRIKDIFQFSNLKEAYVQAIGKLNVDLLEDLNRIHLHDLGIKIELKPDAQEKQALENNISLALQGESISLDDAIEIRSIGNIKLANQVLKVRRKAREKEKLQQEKEMEAARAEGQAMVAERAAQARMQELEFETKSKLTVIQAETEGKMRQLEKEGQVKSMLMDKEFQYNQILQGQQSQIKERTESMKEDRKDRRQTMNNDQRSQMEQDKRFNNPATRFESSEDNISGGIEMGELGPS